MKNYLAIATIVFAAFNATNSFARPIAENVAYYDNNYNLKSVLIAARMGKIDDLRAAFPKIDNPVLRNIIINEAIANGVKNSEFSAFIAPIEYSQKPSKINAQSPKTKATKSIFNYAVTNAEKQAFQNAKAAFFARDDMLAIEYSANYLNSNAGGPLALYGGLASFRMCDFDQALLLFSFAANWQNFDGETASKAAFWAARAAKKIGNNFLENHYLKLAARNGFTFYGQLALETLGEWNSFAVPSLAQQNQSLKRLLNNNIAVKAAMELLEIGENGLAENLLIKAVQNDFENSAGFYQLSIIFGLDKLAAEIDKDDNFAAIAKAYPLSEITPHGNEFVLDRALIFAIMRQESRFNSSAVSYAGARGLMQIMPKTAAWIAKNPAFRTNPELLNNTKVNVTLGENYLEYLLNLNVTESSLPKVLVAYNAGPGNLNSWQKRMIKGQDTLMFIETIPNEQSRDYVKKVMANLWIYHKRLGQKAPSLEKLAQGKIPQYEPQDDPRAQYYGAANPIALKAK